MTTDQRARASAWATALASSVTLPDPVIDTLSEIPSRDSGCLMTTEIGSARTWLSVL